MDISQPYSIKNGTGASWLNLFEYIKNVYWCKNLQNLNSTNIKKFQRAVKRHLAKLNLPKFAKFVKIDNHQFFLL